MTTLPPTASIRPKDNWMLVIEFDPPKVQADSDPESAFPYDAVSRIVSHVSELWSLIPEDLDNVVEWDDTRVVLHVGVLDYLRDLLPWVVMRTIPLSMTLTRHG
jgi:hypothetical protein